MIHPIVPTYPSIAKFTAFVHLKDFRGPTKKEYLRYVRRLGDHHQGDPATLTEDQVRAYFLFLRQEKHFGGSAMKLARCALRAFFRDCLQLGLAWTVFEEVRIAPPQTLPLVLSREQVATLLHAVQLPRHRAVLGLIPNSAKAAALAGVSRRRSAPVLGRCDVRNPSRWKRVGLSASSYCSAGDGRTPAAGNANFGI